MGDREIDYEYLAKLEERLKKLKNPNYKSKQVFEELEKTKDQQLFELITGKDLKFEDNFVEDKPVSTNWLQRKVAPQTVALTKEELVRLVDNDILEKFRAVEIDIDKIVELSCSSETKLQQEDSQPKEYSSDFDIESEVPESPNSILSEASREKSE